MFAIGDKVLHPMHGAGIVDDIIEKRINGVTRQYYNLKLSVGGMLVLVPVETSDAVGLRAVIDAGAAKNAITSLSEIEVDIVQNWNKRYRENILRIKTGEICEISKVVKGLILREKANGLSAGEKKMLNAAKHILVSEISLATGQSYKDVENEVICAIV